MPFILHSAVIHPDSLEPLLEDLAEKHPELDVEIERLFSRMKERFILANVTGTYGI